MTCIRPAFQINQVEDKLRNDDPVVDSEQFQSKCEHVRTSTAQQHTYWSLCSRNHEIDKKEKVRVSLGCSCIVYKCMTLWHSDTIHSYTTVPSRKRAHEPYIRLRLGVGDCEIVRLVGTRRSMPGRLLCSGRFQAKTATWVLRGRFPGILQTRAYLPLAHAQGVK